MRIDPDTLYSPSDLPLTKADLEIVEAHKPRAGWCSASGIKRLMGGAWQWVGLRGDGAFHSWGPPFDLSI